VTKTKRIEHVLVAWIGSILFAGGILASVGGHIDAYFGGFYFWAVAVSFFALLKWIYFGVEKSLKSDARSLSKVELTSTLLAFFILFVSAVVEWKKYKTDIDATRNDPNKFYVTELGGYLGMEWKDYINLVRQTDTQHVVEEYWGIWSATRKIFPAWPVDSVIHALGRTREMATADLKEAEIIISTRYSAQQIWQPWNLSQNFWFYDDLLKNWTPKEQSPATIVWHKNKTARPSRSIECRLGVDSKSIILNNGEPGYYRVEVDYIFSSKGRSLLFVRNNISFAMDVVGYVSINPDNTKVIFPVYDYNGGVTILDFKVLGNKSHNFKLISCVSNSISFVNKDILYTPDPPINNTDIFDDSFFLTDFNWTRGVARNWAGFFLPYTEKNYREYSPGRFVKFASGYERRILRSQPGGQYLNIYIEGDPLDPEKVGLPSSYSVRDFRASD